MRGPNDPREFIREPARAHALPGRESTSACSNHERIVEWPGELDQPVLPDGDVVIGEDKDPSSRVSSSRVPSSRCPRRAGVLDDADVVADAGQLRRQLGIVIDGDDHLPGCRTQCHYGVDRPVEHDEAIQGMRRDHNAGLGTREFRRLFLHGERRSERRTCGLRHDPPRQTTRGKSSVAPCGKSGVGSNETRTFVTPTAWIQADARGEQVKVILSTAPPCPEPQRSFRFKKWS